MKLEKLLTEFIKSELSGEIPPAGIILHSSRKYKSNAAKPSKTESKAPTKRKRESNEKENRENQSKAENLLNRVHFPQVTNAQG